jgi:AcrR family transcriptional regulator
MVWPMPSRTNPPSKQALLASALELFQHHGFQATSLAMLSEHSGVPAAPMMYRHFGDKDGLIVAATDAWEADFRAQLAERLQAQDNPRAKLLGVFDFVERWLADHQWRGWLVADAAIELAEDSAHGVHQVVARHRQAMRALLGDLVGAAGAAGSAALAEQMQVVLDGAMIGAIIERGPGPIRAARTQVEILLSAAGVPGSS